MGQKVTGKVKWFDDKKGFGFISRHDGKGDLFVHHSGLDMDGYRSLKPEQGVEFDVVEAERGPKAVNVRVIG